MRSFGETGVLFPITVAAFIAVTGCHGDGHTCVCFISNTSTSEGRTLVVASNSHSHLDGCPCDHHSHHHQRELGQAEGQFQGAEAGEAMGKSKGLSEGKARGKEEARQGLPISPRLPSSPGAEALEVTWPAREDLPSDNPHFLNSFKRSYENAFRDRFPPAYLEGFIAGYLLRERSTVETPLDPGHHNM